MNVPERTVFDRESFDEDVSASVELNHERAELGTPAEYALLDRDSLVSVSTQPGSVFLLQSRKSPPVLVAALSVEYASAGQGDILLPVGIDQRGVHHALDPFPTAVDGRQIILGIGRERDPCPLRQVEVDIALQMDWAREKGSLRNDNPSATLRSGRVDGTPERLGAIRAPVADGAIVGHPEIAIRNSGRLDPA